MIPLPNELFLSHSSLDREFANEIAGALRRHGIPFWYSEINVIGAQQWHDEQTDQRQLDDSNPPRGLARGQDGRRGEGR